MGNFGARDGVDGFGARDGVDGIGVRDGTDGSGAVDGTDDSGAGDAASVRPSVVPLATVVEVDAPDVLGVLALLKRAQSDVARTVY